MKKSYIFLIVTVLIFIYFGAKIREVLSPVLGAAVLSYFARPFVALLSKKLPKSLSAVLFYIIVFSLIALLVAFILPTVYSGLTELYDYVSSLSESYLFINEKSILSFISKKADSVSLFLKNIFSFLSKSAVAVVLSCFFLMDSESIGESFASLIPEKAFLHIIPALREIDEAFSSFFRGQLLVSVILTVITYATLRILGVRFALILSILYGIFCLIPTAGPFIGAVPVIAAAYLKSPASALWASGLMILTQVLDNSLLSPKIKADSVDISPAAAFLSLYLGAGFFGLSGVILAVPVYASVKIILRRVLAAIS